MSKQPLHEGKVGEELGTPYNYTTNHLT